MKKIIASALAILVGAFGYTITDKAIDERVSELESQVLSQEVEISEVQSIIDDLTQIKTTTTTTTTTTTITTPITTTTKTDLIWPPNTTDSTLPTQPTEPDFIALEFNNNANKIGSLPFALEQEALEVYNLDIKTLKYGKTDERGYTPIWIVGTLDNVHGDFRYKLVIQKNNGEVLSPLISFENGVDSNKMNIYYKVEWKNLNPDSDWLFLKIVRY